jgi:Uma2 family endonuclease
MTVLEKWPEPRPVRLTIEDFLCLADAGAFRHYAKTELIDGQVVAMNAQYSSHARVKSLLLRRLADAVDRALPGFEVWSEVSVAIPPDRLPEPDLAVTNFVPEARAPVPVATVALLVEVSDTTLAYDLGTKLPLYASSGIQEYWVVDLEGRLIHRMWAPSGDRYDCRDQLSLGSTLVSASIPGLSIETEGF